MGAGLGVDVLRLDGCGGVEAGWLGGRVTNRCRQTAGRFPAAGAMRCLPLASSAVLKPAAHMPCLAGTGWPSFFDALPNAVVLEKDNSIPFMPRTEVGGWASGGAAGLLALPAVLRWCWVRANMQELFLDQAPSAASSRPIGLLLNPGCVAPFPNPPAGALREMPGPPGPCLQ